MTPAEAAELACVWEATARKVGNVHPGARFTDLEYTQFVASSVCLGRSFAEAVPFPQWVLNTVTATREAVGTNTNLGLALVLAPLAAAGPTRSAVRTLLFRTSVRDAAAVFAAIREANPGGIGTAAEQDIRDEPTVTLIEAMRLAADRDMIARQYANGFADVFAVGVPALTDGFRRYGCVEAAIIHCQLAWLAEFQDSLIVRKVGAGVAETVRARAAEVLALGGLETGPGRAAGIALDAFLRGEGHRRNPGTTADLVAACLFVALADGILTADAPFPWAAEGWL